jgi:membrane-associated phospholipid phosphatase
MALFTRSAPGAEAFLPSLHVPRLSRRLGAAVLAGLFLVLLADALIRPHALFDAPVLRAMQRVDSPHLDDVLGAVDRLTGAEGAALMWCLVLAAFILARWWVPALLMPLLPAVALGNELISLVAGRERPTLADVERVVSTRPNSFPSGHVIGAVMLYGFVFVVAGRIRPRPLRVAVRGTSLTIIAATGFSRLWYGAHWPTDVLGAYLLGALALLALAPVYRRLEAALGGLPLIRAATPPHEEDRPHAHALTSLVIFDGDTVAKVYAPGVVPRVVYGLAFQAPFPYLANRAALAAAVARRNLAAMLTEYWYGTRRVAHALGVAEVGGRPALVSEYVAGRPPRDRRAARAFLRDLRGRFEHAGLPTWQIDPRQPCALDNLVETAPGVYTVVDLESGLVAPLASPGMWLRALRRGQVPLFDDVFFDITRAYLTREFGLRAWPAHVRARLAGSRERAQGWLGRTVDRWEREARVTTAEADAMRAHMETADFQAVLPHLGAHLVISIVLRFPLGSIARASWSAGALLVATTRLLARRIDRRSWRQAWRIHSPLVILLGAVPGIGGFAYLAARPIRANRLLLRATADAALAKTPWRLYERSGLRRLVARPAGQATPTAPAEAGAANVAPVSAEPATDAVVPAHGMVAARDGDLAPGHRPHPAVRVLHRPAASLHCPDAEQPHAPAA